MMMTAESFPSQSSAPVRSALPPRRISSNAAFARLFERGESVGASLLEWAHVRVFSPWRYNVDAAARRLLDRSGWQAPTPTGCPPAARSSGSILLRSPPCPEIAPNLKLGATVTAITRQGHRQGVSNEARQGFALRHSLRGRVRRAPGSRPRGDRRFRHLVAAEPDRRRRAGGSRRTRSVGPHRLRHSRRDRQSQRSDYAGKRVLVIGGGHSAINVALALMELQDEAPRTEIFWALRHSSVDKASRRRPERPAAGTRRAWPRSQAGDGRRAAEHADVLRRRPHRHEGRRPRRRSHARQASRSASRSIASSSRRASVPTCRSCGEIAHRARPRGRSAACAGSADRSEFPFLRHGSAAWHRRAQASRTRLSRSSARSPMAARRRS